MKRHKNTFSRLLPAQVGAFWLEMDIVLIKIPMLLHQCMLIVHQHAAYKLLRHRISLVDAGVVKPEPRPSFTGLVVAQMKRAAGAIFFKA
jgi:hypothetical protein